MRPGRRKEIVDFVFPGLGYHPSESSKSPTIPDVPDDVQRLERNEIQARNLNYLVLTSTQSDNVITAIETVNAKRVEREEKPNTSVNDVINLYIAFLDQNESLRVAKIEQSKLTETNGRVETELEAAQASVPSMKTSLDANKEELACLVEAR